MKRKSTITVLVIFVILLVYVLLVEVKKEPPPAQDASPTSLPLLAVSLDDLRMLRITDGERVVEVVYRDQIWRITAPQDKVAEQYTAFLAVTDLLQLESNMVVLEEVSDLATYRLDKPALILVIETHSGVREEISVGRQAPHQSDYYALRQGDPRLHLVEQHIVQPFLDWLDAPPYERTEP